MIRPNGSTYTQCSKRDRDRESDAIECEWEDRQSKKKTILYMWCVCYTVQLTDR